MKAIFFATAALIAVVSAPASAAVVTLNIFGTLSNATFTRMTSGLDGYQTYTTTDISGQAYKATASFDLAFNSGGYAFYNLVGFKSNIGGTDGYNSAGGDVNGTSVEISLINDIEYPGSVNYGDRYGASRITFQIVGNALTQNGDLATLNFDNVDYENSTGYFQYDRAVSDGPNTSGDEFYESFGNLKINRISFPAVAAVPEPASWALMIGGFGLVGGTLRRRSMKATSTTTVFA